MNELFIGQYVKMMGMKVNLLSIWAKLLAFSNPSLKKTLNSFNNSTDFLLYDSQRKIIQIIKAKDNMPRMWGKLLSHEFMHYWLDTQIDEISCTKFDNLETGSKWLI